MWMDMVLCLYGCEIIWLSGCLFCLGPQSPDSAEKSGSGFVKCWWCDSEASHLIRCIVVSGPSCYGKRTKVDTVKEVMLSPCCLKQMRGDDFEVYEVAPCGLTGCDGALIA
jgi:hypothetical protein